MRTNSNTILIDNYYGLLRNLSKENKLKLIAKLSNSMIEEVSDRANVVDRFFGSFISDKSAEELINDIRGNRTSNRKIEKF